VTVVLARRAAFGLGAAGLVLLTQGLWIPAKAQLAQVLLDRAFARSVASGEPVKPWPWADTVPVARIEAVRLGVSEVVLSGGSGEAMAFGPTELGNLPHDIRVLAGHRDTHFRFVRNLKHDDTLVLSDVDGSTARYRVFGFATVRWDRFAYPLLPNRPLLVLATCDPADPAPGGPQRLVVWAERIGGEEEASRQKAIDKRQ
jgi:sortase A